MALEITDANFDELVLKSDKPVLVDFWAEWCGPCRMVGPVVEEIAKEYDGQAVVGKVNVDNNPGISMKFGIRNIPDEHIQPFLYSEAPRLMFPFARRILADAVRDGGFPPLLLDPIDFAGLYTQQLQAQAAAQTAPIGEA